MNYPEQIIGESGAEASDVVHVIIPGRGRSEDGMGLSEHSQARAEAAAAFYTELGLAERSGVVVCSGYKTPADKSGRPYYYLGERFQGRPEAVSTAEQVIDRGVPSKFVKIEPYSFDTPTNFAFSRNRLPDKRTVGAMAQREHLERMMYLIIPHIMDQPTVGLVVPEIAGIEDHDNAFARMASRIVVAGLNPNSSMLEERVSRRAERVWNFVLFATDLKQNITGSAEKYPKPDADSIAT